MPDWQCWCDQDWYASVLADCRMASSDLETPFRCPTDVFFHSGKLDEALVHFRMASFLSNPRVRALNDPPPTPLIYADPLTIQQPRCCCGEHLGALTMDSLLHGKSTGQHWHEQHYEMSGCGPSSTCVAGIARQMEADRAWATRQTCCSSADKSVVFFAKVPQLLQQDTEWVHVVPPAVAETRDDSLARFNLSIPAGLSGEPRITSTPARNHIPRTLRRMLCKTLSFSTRSDQRPQFEAR